MYCSVGTQNWLCRFSHWPHNCLKYNILQWEFQSLLQFWDVMPSSLAERYRRRQSISRECFPCTLFICTEHLNYTYNNKSVWCNDDVNTNENKIYHPFNYAKRIAEIINSIINFPHPIVHEQMNVAYTRKRVEIYMVNYYLNQPISQKFTQIPTASFASLIQNFKYTFSLLVTSIPWIIKAWKIKQHIAYDTEKVK